MALLTDAASALLAPGRWPGLGDLADVLRQERVAGRRASLRDGRAIIEVRGAGSSHAAQLGARLAQALEELPGVSWARLNAPLERVIVGLATDGDASPPSLTALVDVVSRAEREYESPAACESSAAREPKAETAAEPDPADGSPVDGGSVSGAALALAAGGAGLVMSAVGVALRLPRLPPEVASAATVIDSQPRLRGSVESVAGRSAADLGLALVSALSQGLAGGRFGLAVDVAHRVGRLGELLGARSAWRAREAELLAGPERAQADPVYRCEPK